MKRGISEDRIRTLIRMWRDRADQANDYSSLAALGGKSDRSPAASTYRQAADDLQYALELQGSYKKVEPETVPKVWRVPVSVSANSVVEVVAHHRQGALDEVEKTGVDLPGLCAECAKTWDLDPAGAEASVGCGGVREVPKTEKTIRPHCGMAAGAGGLPVARGQRSATCVFPDDHEGAHSWSPLAEPKPVDPRGGPLNRCGLMADGEPCVRPLDHPGPHMAEKDHAWPGPNPEVSVGGWLPVCNQMDDDERPCVRREGHLGQHVSEARAKRLALDPDYERKPEPVAPSNWVRCSHQGRYFGQQDGGVPGRCIYFTDHVGPHRLGEV